MYGESSGVHAAHMSKKARPAPKPKPLVWRRSHIRDWRNYRKVTLEQLAERLAALDPPITTTHASLGRLERGMQLPKIDLIEALAKVLNTDVDSMLNRLPSDDSEFRPLWNRASDEQKELILGITQKIVK
jgi:transcriptional regulator with XRE-family HTH domain